ncbi:MAG: MlaE family ABC transporter permease [Oligoflexales bacterium]
MQLASHPIGRLFQSVVIKFGSLSVQPLSALGRYVLFCLQVFRCAVSRSWDFRLLFQQMEFVGIRSFWIIVLAAMMIGAVFGIQFGQIFKLFGIEAMIGAAASFALSRELAPIVGAFLVTGRAGSAMAAEIATMKVNEQLDAMRVMSVNPVHYLVVPRVMASILMMPFLTAFFIIVGVASSYIIGILLFQIDEGIFFTQMRWITQPKHVLQGMQKAMVFGFIISTVGCYSGFFSSGGAKGVGASTTTAVVVSLVAVLVSDFFISYIQIQGSSVF